MSLRISGLILVLLNLAVFAQVTGFDFIHFDDDLYIVDNPYVNQGLTADGLRYAFSSEPAPMSNPLALVSHMLDVELFGPTPRWHHLTNLLLHIANSLLMLAIFARMTGKSGAAFVIAALFAVHPLHVETVAWISDRKDLLSTVFWLATVWAYVEYARRPNMRWLFGASLLYALSLLAKPMAVTLPFVLLLLDWWPLGRLNRQALGARIAEKTPFFVLSIIACAATLYLQGSGGATAGLEHFSVGERIANALAAYGIYVRQTVWPFGLGVYYLAPPAGAGAVAASAGAAVVLLLVALAIAQRKSMPWIAVGVFWFLGMLVPVIGLVQVGNQLHADRYTYLPIVGLFVAAVFSVDALLSRSRAAHSAQRVASTLAGIVIVALAVRAFDQTALWRNSEKLLTHTLAVGGESLLMRNNLGNYYLDNGWLDQAHEQYVLAERISPGHLLPTYNLAYLARMYGDFNETIRRLEPLAVAHPDDIDVRLLLAESFLQTGLYEAAVAHATAAQLSDPVRAEPKASILLGLSYERIGRLDQARQILLAAADAHFENAGVQVTAANFLARNAAIADAVHYYDRALEIAPWDPTVYYNIGAAFEHAGALDQARAAYEQAVAIDPMFMEAQYRLDALANPGGSAAASEESVSN